MNDPALRTLAERLAGSAGLAVPRTVEPMAGGRNNRVFRLSFPDDPDAVLKAYHHDPRDPRDRLRAEWSFLTHVCGHGVGNVPQPLACDPSAHAALYSFVAGRRPAEANEFLVGRAAEFVIAVNAGGDDAPLAPASEACFSLDEHLATIDRRVARLNNLDDDAPLVEQARTFVAGKLVAAWDAVRAGVLQQAAERGASLGERVRAVVSPSDFGFHNALVDTEGRVSFLDFEYAGIDDPAKMICDFFCQPELPAPLRCYDEFVGRLAAPLGLREPDLWRTRLLLDAYRIKWVCIMLNEFSSLGAGRRAFARAGDDEARAALRLRNAERYLDLIAS